MSKDSVLQAKLYFLEKILFGRVKVTGAPNEDIVQNHLI